MRKIETHEWWPELVKLKDTLSLRELAEKFEVTPGAISAAFKRTGTTRRPAPPGPRSRRKEIVEALPPEPGELEGGRPGSKDDLILRYRDLLGEVPDAEVADRAGVSVRTIASFRARHDIKGFSGPRRLPQEGLGRKSKIDAHADLVGQVPDRVVAEKAGVTLNAVRNYRAKHGISAVGHVPTPAPAPARVIEPRRPEMPSVPGGASAWRVITEVGEDRTIRVVVADSLSHAAQRAESASVGHVVALEYIGAVI